MRESAASLRRGILQLAVRSQLSRPEPGDEPVAALLSQIGAEKARLVREKKIKKPEALPPVSEDEKPFEIPEHWEWVRLDELCYQITDGTHYTPIYTPTGVPFLSVKDISKGFIDFRNTRFISPEEHAALTKRCKPEKGDLLLTKVGTTGIAKVVDVDEEFSIFVSLALLKFPQVQVHAPFLELVINSPFARGQSERDTQGVGNKNLVLKFIRAFILPFPPLAEQKRIVAAVETLFADCDALEAANRAQMERGEAAWAALEAALTG